MATVSKHKAFAHNWRHSNGSGEDKLICGCRHIQNVLRVRIATSWPKEVSMAHLACSADDVINISCPKINARFPPKELIFNQSGSSLWHQEDLGSSSISKSHSISESHLLIG